MVPHHKNLVIPSKRAELADVTIILSYLHHDLGIDPNQAVADKRKRNRAKYPVEKARGTARKYNGI